MLKYILSLWILGLGFLIGIPLLIRTVNGFAQCPICDINPLDAWALAELDPRIFESEVYPAMIESHHQLFRRNMVRAEVLVLGMYC